MPTNLRQGYGRQACIHCRQPFSVPEEDLEFYKLVSPMIAGKRYLIPPPTHCPACRRQRRLAWRNEKTLYRRTCDYSKKTILSIYSPDKPFTVYESDVWNSDVWDPMTYGREIDWNRPFFDQWNDLHHAVPLPSFNLRFQNNNSEYTNLSQRNNNCYLIFAGNDNEDCYYGTYLHRNHRVVDGFLTFDSESCYEVIDAYNCNRLFFSEDCRNCSDSLLLKSCQGCQNCIGCVNLVNKNLHIGNQPCTKEEYTKKLNEITHNRAAFLVAEQTFQALILQHPHKALSGYSNENVTGDHITNCRNVRECFDMTHDEDCKYCVWMHQSRNCYDCYGWGMTGELGLENHLTGQGFYNVQFSESSWGNVSNLMYCRYCLDTSSNLFGCIGLRHKEYCILNKQYTKEEYESILPKLIEHMIEHGEYGQFFPAQLSPYGYNETVAQEYFPLTQDQIEALGWNWKQESNEAPKVTKTIPGSQLPESIADVPDEIVEWAVVCDVTGRPFKITPQELQFYRDMGLPLPRKCFDQRHKDRMAKRTPRQLWERRCGKCGEEIRTSYPPSRPDIVYCEDCYLDEVH
ncbi:MAG: hypothetical protein PHZ00_04025 [Candidatus Peribacteraceae bacterium]|nr:hypothetical protein [Candidatus Peribacteraceae bacterium]